MEGHRARRTRATETPAGAQTGELAVLSARGQPGDGRREGWEWPGARAHAVSRGFRSPSWCGSHCGRRVERPVGRSRAWGPWRAGVPWTGRPRDQGTRGVQAKYQVPKCKGAKGTQDTLLALLRAGRTPTHHLPSRLGPHHAQRTSRARKHAREQGGARGRPRSERTWPIGSLGSTTGEGKAAAGRESWVRAGRLTPRTESSHPTFPVYKAEKHACRGQTGGEPVLKLRAQVGTHGPCCPRGPGLPATHPR